MGCTNDFSIPTLSVTAYNNHLELKFLPDASWPLSLRASRSWPPLHRRQSCDRENEDFTAPVEEAGEYIIKRSTFFWPFQFHDPNPVEEAGKHCPNPPRKPDPWPESRQTHSALPEAQTHPQPLRRRICKKTRAFCLSSVTLQMGHTCRHLHHYCRWSSPSRLLYRNNYNNNIPISQVWDLERVLCTHTLTYNME